MANKCCKIKVNVCTWHFSICFSIFFTYPIYRLIISFWWVSALLLKGESFSYFANVCLFWKSVSCKFFIFSNSRKFVSCKYSKIFHSWKFYPRKNFQDFCFAKISYVYCAFLIWLFWCVIPFSFHLRYESAFAKHI